MRNKSTKQYMYTLGIIVALLFIGIGYAALTRTLNISGKTTVAKNTWNVHFVGNSVSHVAKSENTEVTKGAAVEGNGTQVNFTVKFNYPGDYYYFTVDITNGGSLDAMVSSVNLSAKTGTIPDYLNYFVVYNDNTAIEPLDALGVGKTETIKVFVQYREGSTITAEALTELSLNIVYEQAGSNWVQRLGSNATYNLVANGALSDETVDLDKTSRANGTNGKYKLGTTAANPFPIYYYRGNVDNNIIFNNMCWKIVSTTTTGGTKLIYNGVPTNGTCVATGKDAAISQHRWSGDFSNSAAVAYSTSEMKTEIENWFATNFSADTQRILEDTPFYNESTYIPYESSPAATDIAGAYPPGIRVFGDFSSWENGKTNNTIALGTNDYNEGEIYTKANGRLNYPVGLITIDEFMLAGGLFDSVNAEFYLYTGAWYWTMSPGAYSAYANKPFILYVGPQGESNGSYTLENGGGCVRPVVSLKAGTKYNAGGNGTATKPYVVTEG